MMIKWDGPRLKYLSKEFAAIAKVAKEVKICTAVHIWNSFFSSLVSLFEF